MIQRAAYIKRSALVRKPAKPRPEGWDDPEFLAWCRTWPCYVCFRRYCESVGTEFWKAMEDPVYRGVASLALRLCGPTDAAHIGQRGIRQIGQRGIRQRCKDREAMPLGKKHHLHQTAGGGPESHHTLGKRFWHFHGLERETVIAILNRLYHQETGK